MRVTAGDVGAEAGTAGNVEECFGIVVVVAEQGVLEVGAGGLEVVGGGVDSEAKELVWGQVRISGV